MADSTESEDDMPLIKRRPTGQPAAPSAPPQKTALPSSANGSANGAPKPVVAASKPVAPAAPAPAAVSKPSEQRPAPPAVQGEQARPGPAPAGPSAAKPAAPEAKAAAKPSGTSEAKAAPKADAKAAPGGQAKTAGGTSGTADVRPASSKPVVQAKAAGESKPAPTKPAVKATDPKPAAKPPAKPAANGSASAAAVPGAKRRRSSEPPSGSSSSSSSSDDEEASSSGDDSEADIPLSQRRAANTPARAAVAKKPAAASAPAKRKRGASGGGGGSGGPPGLVMWTTLVHAGVMFPPEYVPHGIKMLYDGTPVALTAEQEEVASMWASMKESDYCTKPVFIKNFWEGFKEVLGKNHIIKRMELCDFTPIFDHFNAEKEIKKLKTREEKAAEKVVRDAASLKYLTAMVDGRPEPVGNFRVEPPGLFRGRGEHPRMGKVKKRIYPKDIVINIGTGVPIPEHPYPGQSWKEVRHDRGVTWLAYWKDTISASSFKYVFLGATSSFKADSDQAKYERARKLKGLIAQVRTNYERDWESSDMKRRQMGVAMYFLDKLALRAGHEKDEDEADTVGCCTLKVENVDVVAPSSIKFDFLGKDSIRYENTVEVDKRVYASVEKFKRVDQYGKRKSVGDHLFETFDAGDLNKELKEIMEGLSVKVFRTYNASVTLDRLLVELEERAAASGADMLLDQKKADYDIANKEVAILCNHQRSIPKTHGNQMEKIQEKLDAMVKEIADLKEDLRKALRGETVLTADNKPVKADAIQKKLEGKEKALAKAKVLAKGREDLKTVSLGTSKINYMDPRITVAWCKRNEVPIEKVFNKSLIAKFNWAMEVEPEFRF